MRLTTKGRYAVSAMLDLAINAKQHPVKLAEISERQAISLSYLEQLFAKLRRNQLVKSVRGPGGGYQLNAAVDKISIADIIMAVNETLNVSRCEGKGNCNHGNKCLTHQLWMDLSDRIQNFLSDITIGELLRKNADLQATDETHNNAHLQKLTLA